MKTVELPRIPVRGATIWPLTVAAYHALGEADLIPKNTELLYGFVYQKMPKSPFHSFLVQLLHEILLRSLPAGHLVRTEQPITCADSEPEPDLAVIKGDKEDFRHAHPRTAELVVEICVASHEYDRSKLHAYASAGVREVWLVLAPEKQIEVHRKPVDGKFAEQEALGPGGRLSCVTLPEFTLGLDVIFSK